MTNAIDTAFLLKALALARSRLGETRVNPAVAAIIVQDNHLLSYGVHQVAGTPHAEVVAINRIKSRSLLATATLYVTLEPCVHQGKTPPCTQAIIASGIKRVVFAYIDPNPLVKQSAMAQLRQAGVACEQITVPEIDQFYFAYNYWQSKQQSCFSAKIAMTQNRVVCLQNGSPTAITATPANYWTHQQRLQHHAILTTGATLRNDQPRLNVRYRSRPVIKPIIMLSETANIPTDMPCLNQGSDMILIHGGKAKPSRLAVFADKGVQCYMIDPPITTTAYWVALAQISGSLGYHSVWCELGPNILLAALQSNMIAHYYKITSPDLDLIGQTLDENHEKFLSFKEKTQKSLHHDQLISYTMPRISHPD